jgi:hypothetical protein
MKNIALCICSFGILFHASRAVASHEDITISAGKLKTESYLNCQCNLLDIRGSVMTIMPDTCLFANEIKGNGTLNILGKLILKSHDGPAICGPTRTKLGELEVMIGDTGLLSGTSSYIS